MFTMRDIKDNKLALIMNIVITIGVLTRERGGSIKAFYQALGSASIYIPLAYVLIGIIAVSIIKSVHNLIKPENKVKFSIIDKANFSILCLWIFIIIK